MPSSKNLPTWHVLTDLGFVNMVNLSDYGVKCAEATSPTLHKC